MLTSIETLLQRFSDETIFEQYYFTGGTALAHYLNHRISYDLDFIATTKLNPNSLKALSLRHNGKFIPDPNASTFRINTGNVIDEYKMMFSYDGIKVEFFHLNNPMTDTLLTQYTALSQPLFGSIKILPLDAIARLKLFALFQRQKIRDLFDVLVLLEKDILDIETIEQYHAMHHHQTFVEFVEGFEDDETESLDFIPKNDYYSLLNNAPDKLSVVKDKLIQIFVHKSLL